LQPHSDSYQTTPQLIDCRYTLLTAISLAHIGSNFVISAFGFQSTFSFIETPAESHIRIIPTYGLDGVLKVGQRFCIFPVAIFFTHRCFTISTPTVEGQRDFLMK
jgi:hypothetical protein